MQKMTLVNWNESMERISQFEERAEQAFVMMAATGVFKRYAQNPNDYASIDMCLLVDIMRDMYQQRDVVIRVLSGEDVDE